MNLTVRKTTTAIAAFATMGAGSMFLAASPAAAVDTCGSGGALVSPGICELKFTSDGNFIKTAEMTKLEVLLVGAGGNTSFSPRQSGEPAPSNGYAAAGGGGEVRVVDFSAATGQVDVVIGESNDSSTWVEDAEGLLEGADNGNNGTGGSEGVGSGGTSGSGNLGQQFTNPSASSYGSGGGAGSIGLGNVGGTGVVVGDIVPDTSLFSNYTSCFGGGGGAGFVSTVEPITSVLGSATCGGGFPTDNTATALVAAVPNSGGGAGAVNFAVSDQTTLAGADGLVVVRWPAALAATGSEMNPAPMVIGMSALVAGIGLAMAAAYTRKRRES